MSARQPKAPEPQQHFGLLLSSKRAALYLGVSTSEFQLLRHAEGFPAPVPVPGRGADSVTRRYRREDLRDWTRSLKAEGRQP